MRGPPTITNVKSSPNFRKKKDLYVQRVLTIKPNSALRIPVKLGSTQVSSIAIIDTGSAISVLGVELATQLPGLTWSEPYSGPAICIANGKYLKILGVSKVDVLIGETHFQIPAIVVEDFPFGFLLGNDFLETRVKIDLVNGKLEIGNQVICFIKESKSNSALVTDMILKDTVTLQPKSLNFITSEQITNSNSNSLVIFEPNKELQTKFSILGARSILSSESNIRIPLLNPFSKPVVLKSQTCIGTVELHTDQQCLLTELVDSTNSVDKSTSHVVQNQFISKIRSSDVLSVQHKQLLNQLLWKYHHVFSGYNSKPAKTELTNHKIDTGDVKPIKVNLRRLGPKEAQAESLEIKKMLKDDVIEKSDSPWSSPVVLVRKKDGSLRFCVDYRKLNNVTKKDVYPIPRIDDTLDSVAGATVFSALDLAAGYWQIPLDPTTKEKTAFITKEGLFQFKVLPFGLTNAPATFQRLMDTVLKNFKWQFCLVYMDDVIIFSKSFEEHLIHLESIFKTFQTANLLLKLEKCNFCLSSIPFLGHIISKDGISTNPKNVEAIVKFSTPKNIEDIRRFLGLANHYRKFICKFSSIIFPLTSLLQKNVPFIWTNDCQLAFDTIKSQLISAPILAYPDFNLSFKLTCDASLVGIGSILSQIQEGKEKVIGYASRTLSRPERNYSTTERECLAIVHACKIFRPYIYGNQVQVITDHAALQWLFKQKDPPSRLHRWIYKISDLNLDVKYQSGKSIQHVDALSRAPVQFVTDTNLKQSLLLAMESSRSVPLELFREAQLKDKFLDKFRKSTKEIEGESFVTENSLLYRIKKQKKQSKVTQLKQLVVPEKFKNDILLMCHDNLLSGHLGITATYLRLIQRFWWQGMKKDTIAWVKSCPDCEAKKTPKGISKVGKLQSIPVVPEPFYTIGVDIVGPLTTTENPRNNRYIIVFTDYFTKWAEAFAMQSQDAETIAKIFVEQIICRHGVPRRIISDRGKVFIGKIMNYVYKLLDIEKLTTTAYHPQTDGLTERLNQTLVNILSKYVGSKHKDWDVYLPFALHAYRTAIQTSTKFSPHYLLYGREPVTPLDVALFPKPPETKSIPDYIKNLLDNLQEAKEIAHHNIEVAQSKQTSNYDSKRRMIEFQPGDKVRIWIPSSKKGQTPKLLCNWFGPYEVIERKSSVTYKVATLGQRPIHGVIHVSRMKTYQDPSTPLPSSKNYIPDPDELVLDPNKDETPDYTNADLPYPYEKLDDASVIIEDDIQGFKGEEEEEELIDNSGKSKEDETNIEIDEKTNFPLTKANERTKNKLPGPEEQEEILDKKIVKKNGKSRTIYLVKWKNNKEPTWHPRAGLLTSNFS